MKLAASFQRNHHLYSALEAVQHGSGRMNPFLRKHSSSWLHGKQVGLSKFVAPWKNRHEPHFSIGVGR